MILGQNLKLLVCSSMPKMDQEMMFGDVLDW